MAGNAKLIRRYNMSEKETDPKPRYMATVTALDDAIGRVLSCLDEQAHRNTFIFCFSDNGASDVTAMESTLAERTIA